MHSQILVEAVSYPFLASNELLALYITHERFADTLSSPNMWKKQHDNKRYCSTVEQSVGKTVKFKIDQQ